MYHRNKVHTDEFWRYELTKNRRSFVDDRVNEDLWKKQLGKHGEETESKPVKQETTVSPAATPALNASEAKEEQMKWLEQINRSSSSQMSPEMKLFALQSLQKSLQSLQYMSSNTTTGVVTPNKAEAGSIRPESAPSPAGSHHQLPHLPKELPGGLKQELTDAPTNDSSYLALLAQISRRESATMQEGGDDPMPPTSSESAANRTQMWLAQVTKYRSSRSSSGLKEEPHNHDTLWEQQIARIKNNPVRSPLEPVEITLDDDTTVVVVSKTNSTVLSASNINITNNSIDATESLPVYQSLPVPHAPMEPLPGPASSPRHSQHMSVDKEEDEVKEGRSNEDQSMLKSLLLDRFKRKRSSASSSESSGLAKRPGKSPPPPASQPITVETSPPASQPAPGSEPPQEILRKRLLGWVDQPATPPPAATATAYQGSQPQQQQPTQQPAAVDLRATEPPHQHQRQPQQAGSTVKEEESRKEEQQVSYTQTSVLKHLLYRYTAGVKK